MRTQGFGAFIDMLRAAFAHAGGVRIDHILGLRRLWLVPDGEPAQRGAYLHYPCDDLLRLIALESWRHRAVVIGEDLGTVPAGLRERLAESGLLGIRVLWFEQGEIRARRDANETGTRDKQILFKSPQAWDTTAAATTTTHDLPTVTGWWRGSDIDWRAHVGQIAPAPQADAVPGSATAAPATAAPGGPAPLEQALAAAHALREQERRALWRAFEQAGVAVPGHAMPPREAAPLDETLAFVGMTPAPLVTYPLEDLLGLAEQPNLPGSIDEHPNWRRRMSASIAQLFEDAALARRLTAIRAQRPGGAS
jgi:4-alpha-glucanotransferase